MDKDILLEIARCYASIDYGIGKYFQTYDRVTGGLQPLNMYPKRIELINAHKNNRYNLIYKSRQVGGSTLLAAMAAMTLATPDPYDAEHILVINNKLDMSAEFIEKVRIFLLQLPREFWGEDYIGSEQNLNKEILITNKKNEIVLPNHSRIRAVSSSRDALRGYRPSWIIMEEAAYINNGVDLFGCGLTSLGAGGSITLISTPNGYDELFYKTYSEALDGNNAFNISRIMWYEDPRFNKDLSWIKGTEVIKEKEYTSESYRDKERNGYRPTSSWYRDMENNLRDPRHIAQELDARFI